MYYKRSRGKILIQKLTERWVRWTHRSEGKTHCEECLKLDGRWFSESKTPKWPHHPFCHCALEPIDDTAVLMYAATHSDYSKFDPYLFNTTGKYTHTKEKLFQSWGYTVNDAKWLQAEIEKQSLEKYVAGDYQLGKLNDQGQRISIRITIPRRDTGENISFITGWMMYPNGKILMTTPYGGK